MKEYLVHIEIEDKDQSHSLIFRSSTLTVLYLAIDDFRKAISNVHVPDRSTMNNVQWALTNLTENFERQLTTVEEKDQFDEEEKASQSVKNRKMKKDNEDDEEDEEPVFQPAGRPEPALKISYPGAE